MAEIIAVGEILVEIMTVNRDQPLDRQGLLTGPFPSGAPAIFIDQAARMGASCGLIAKVGNDDFGKLNVNRLKSDGVDTSHILIDDAHTTGTAFVTYFSDGSRKFIFHFEQSAAGHLSPADVDSAFIRKARYLHVMGCSLAAGDSLRNAVLQAVVLAKENNLTVSFDPNIRSELLQSRFVRELFFEILERTDILLTSPTEMRMLLGEDYESLTRERLRKGLKMVLYKNGEKGVRVSSAEDDFFLPPFPVNEIDPTGAGDSFDGAFIACISQGMDVRKAAVVANAAGALSVTRKGPMEGVHGREEIFAFLKESGEEYL